MTVQETIENNDNLRIRIDRRFVNDDCDPRCANLFEGNSYDVPDYLRQLEVKGSAWSVGHECPVLDVLVPGHFGDDAIEKLKEQQANE